MGEWGDGSDSEGVRKGVRSNVRSDAITLVPLAVLVSSDNSVESGVCSIVRLV